MIENVLRHLTRYDYPPNAEAKAFDFVLYHAELFARSEAVEGGS